MSNYHDHYHDGALCTDKRCNNITGVNYTALIVDNLADTHNALGLQLEPLEHKHTKAMRSACDELKRLNEFVDSISKWHIVGPLTSEQGCQLMRICALAKDVLDGWTVEQSLKRS